MRGFVGATLSAYTFELPLDLAVDDALLFGAQRQHGDGLEVDDVFIAVILQADPALVGTQAAVGFVGGFLSGTGWPSV